jgi:toxin-antitoxin system PIN domain toxin
VIAVDTNLLVYAHRAGVPEHRAAADRLRQLAEGQDPWGLPVFCLGEFVRVVTHPKLRPPSTLDQTFGFLGALLQSPSLRLLLPSESFPQAFESAVRDGGATGNLSFDAQIVAMCREARARTLVTNDRDFARFPGLSLERVP